MDKPKHLYEVLATPGLGLTVVCVSCIPHVDIFKDPYDATLDTILIAVEDHEKGE
jgi:hypothetical protein